jgi:cytochrome P450
MELGSLLTRLASREIDSLAFRSGDERMVLLNTPGHARHVLTTNADNYTKDNPANRHFRNSVVDGILTANGEHWAAQRALLAPFFRQTDRLSECAVACVEELCLRLARHADTGEPLNLAAAITRLTLEIATRTMFGVRPERFLDPSIEVGTLLDGAISMLPAEGDKLMQVRRSLLDAFTDEIADVEGEPAPILRALLEDPAHRGGEVLANQAVTLLLTGFETLASSLTWVWILLMQHPDIYASMQRSLDSGNGSLVRGVVSEAFRLYPSAWIFSRRAVAEDDVDGVRITAGSTVAISPYLIHRRARWWSDPNEFRPERFMPGGGRPPDRYAYIPFGAGRRFCLGSAYALEEAGIIVSALASRLTFEPAGDVADARPEFRVVLRAPDPMLVMVRARTSLCERSA